MNGSSDLVDGSGVKLLTGEPKCARLGTVMPYRCQGCGRSASCHCCGCDKDPNDHYAVYGTTTCGVNQQIMSAARCAQRHHDLRAASSNLFGVLLALVIFVHLATSVQWAAAAIGSRDRSRQMPDTLFEGSSVVSLESSCETGGADRLDQQSGGIVRTLKTLKCAIKPLIKTFEQFLSAAYGKEAQDLRAAVTSSLSGDILADYAEFLEKFDQFYEGAIYVVRRKDFCTYPTISQLIQLKEISSQSEILTKAYDLISIDFHSACLIEALERLPEVPALVKEVVQIYISGAASPIPDLNDPRPQVEEEFRFDVEVALKKNGPLQDVVGLLLTSNIMSGKDGVSEFKASCRNLVIDLEQRWLAMEIMSHMLDSEGNKIREFNNYVMRSLTTTNYADACSQLSATS